MAGACQWRRRWRQKEDLPEAIDPVTPMTLTFLNALNAAAARKKVTKKGFANEDMSDAA